MIGTWDKEDKDGKEIEQTRGAKLVSGYARVTRVAKKTKHICEFRFQTRSQTNRGPHKGPKSAPQQQWAHSRRFESEAALKG